MFKDNWLLGIGVGNQNFREIYGLYMKTGFDALSAYNIYLETAVESGIFALLAFLSFVATLLTSVGVKIHFAVMAIESGAEKLNISGQEMEDRLQKQDLIRKRLLDQYEMLHTQSLDYVADDIAETLLNWEQSND